MTYPQIDPIAFSIGPLSLHWYGIMYIFAFLGGWFLGRVRAARPGSGWTVEEIDDLVTWEMLGVILGGRLGYILFYDLHAYLADPMEIFRVWNGGMSFHGGLLGVLAASFFWAVHSKRRFWQVTDFIAPIAPIGLFFGRLGNFINAELWGKVSNVSWAMVFPGAGPDPRHPTQLYEAGLEGLVLFFILWIFARKPRPIGAVSGLFAVLYALFRIFCEFFRVPDAHLGYLFGDFVTMGQLLSLPLLVIGILLLIYAYYRGKHPLTDRIVLEDGTVYHVKRYKK